VKSRFHAAAETDLTEDVAYYDGATPGLGDRLLAEVRIAVTFLETYPMAASVKTSRRGCKSYAHVAKTPNSW
jgi:hypothetical protein